MEDPHSNLFVPIELVALDTVQNVRHRYAVRVTADLFGAFIVETEWGKIGTKGQSNRRAFNDQSDAARYVSSLLRRRDNAEKRIGRAYAPVQPVFS
mgnify:CR=1 FL=1